VETTTRTGGNIIATGRNRRIKEEKGKKAGRLKISQTGDGTYSFRREMPSEATKLLCTSKNAL